MKYYGEFYDDLSEPAVEPDLSYEYRKNLGHINDEIFSLFMEEDDDDTL